MNVIDALKACGYLVSGSTIVAKFPKDSTISIEEANECTDNYSKKLCTNENPYYYIETDECNAESRYDVPSLDRYHRVNGKPVAKSALRTELDQRKLMWESTK